MRRALTALGVVLLLFAGAVLYLETRKTEETGGPPVAAGPTAAELEAFNAPPEAQPELAPAVASAPAAGEVAPRLSAVSRAEYERELPPGAGCDLQAGGRLLLVAVADDAVAKVDGRITHLRFEGGLPALVRGGRFSADELFIRVEPSAQLVSRDDETSGRAARVEVAHRGGARSGFRGVWTCGA